MRCRNKRIVGTITDMNMNISGMQLQDTFLEATALRICSELAVAALPDCQSG